MATMKVNESFLVALDANADLTTSLNLLVKVLADGSVGLGGLNDKVLGSIYEAGLSSSAPFGPVTVQFAGIAKVKAASAIEAGQRVNCAAGGKAAAGATNPIGIALSTVAANNEMVQVALIGG